jgi:hypothetical protein
VHKSVFERCGVFDPQFRYAEETEFFHRVAASFPVAVLLSPLVRYRVAQAGSLTSPENTARLIKNALLSLDNARQLRPRSRSIRRAFRAGMASLLVRWAYTNLSNYDPRLARHQIRIALRYGAAAKPRAWSILLASFLPASTLRSLHALKRRFRS